MSGHFHALRTPHALIKIWPVSSSSSPVARFFTRICHRSPCHCAPFTSWFVRQYCFKWCVSAKESKYARTSLPVAYARGQSGFWSKE